MENSLDVVILAAGKGTRMRSRRPKVLHPILGLPLLEYVLRTARALSPRRVVVVISHGADEVRRAFAGQDVVFVEQGERPGTGHALRCAREALGAPRFFVLPGDVPLVPPEALEELLREHVARAAVISLLSFRPEEPGGYGRVVRDESGTPRAIVEAGDAPPEVLAVREVNSGIYCVENAPALWEALEGISDANAGGECRLADLVAALYPRTHAFPWREPEDLVGVDTRGDLARAEWLLRRRIIARLQEAGVTVVDPHTAYIGPDVAVGGDTVLHPGVYLYGRTEIAAACEIGPQAYLVDTAVEREARIWFSVLEGAYVGEGARIGPYAHLRPGARIGNFVEIKNAEIGEGVRAGHLAYIGDAEVGPGTNIGAGTITCNFDGVRKHRTVIGRGAFIGSNTALVAPVTVGEGAVVGAGSVITEDVPPYALALGRSRQVIKPDWAKKKGGA
ncbi:MAG: UDP-N-acetylglucosamine diphosphorylase/glucosamine-1-phosphate N-acetyltransferase [Caldiserica bacterium]|nr:UDP-N-acetylglucosamine diphosphorylase/glucosamine-1-phosphate N-acetyltransferase [Caldisericota bacterium]